VIDDGLEGDASYRMLEFERASEDYRRMQLWSVVEVGLEIDSTSMLADPLENRIM
jgi:hypothetical protein